MSPACTRGNKSLESSKLPARLTQAKSTFRTNAFELDLVGSFLHRSLQPVNKNLLYSCGASMGGFALEQFEPFLMDWGNNMNHLDIVHCG
jgi:hypothetical protein